MAEMRYTPIGIFARAFGCWHRRLGPPVTHGGETYRACVGCGAHRLFDTQTWRCYGPYFYEEPPAVYTNGAEAPMMPARRALALVPKHAG